MNLYELDEDGVVNEYEYAESEMFEIVSPTGVEGGELTFALRAKNPSTNGIQLTSAYRRRVRRISPYSM